MKRILYLLLLLLHGLGFSQQEYQVARAESEIYDTYGDRISVVNKKKSLSKFGTNELIGSSQATIMDFPSSSELEEEFVYDNLIAGISSDSASNTGQVTIEGHTIASTISSTITRSGTTATVTTSTDHDLKVNDGVIVSGANQSDYNGRVRVLSVPSSTTFTYYVANSPTTPATGTILSRPVHYTFIVQTAILNGQTQVLLSTPLSTATRLYNSGSTALAEDSKVFVYDTTGVSLSSGVPDDNTKVHVIMNASDNQSRKASTTISNSDYWIISDIQASVNKKTTATVDIRVQVQLPYGTWRTVYPIISLSSTGNNTFPPTDLPVPIYVPRNSNFRITAVGSTTNISVTAGASGYLAKVMNL